MTWKLLFLTATAILVGALSSSCGGGASANSQDLTPTGGSTGGPSGSNPPVVSLFDAKGSTSAFGIPTGLTGTIDAGQAVFTTSCAGCHGSGAGLPALNYTQFKARLASPPMNSLSLTEQQIADVVAWLNRNSTGSGSGGGGTVTPGGQGSGDDAAGDDASGAGAEGNDSDTAGSDDNTGAGDTAGADDSASGGSAGSDSGADGTGDSEGNDGNDD